MRSDDDIAIELLLWLGLAFLCGSAWGAVVCWAVMR